MMANKTSAATISYTKPEKQKLYSRLKKRVSIASKNLKLSGIGYRVTMLLFGFVFFTVVIVGSFSFCGPVNVENVTIMLMCLLAPVAGGYFSLHISHLMDSFINWYLERKRQ